MNQTTVLPNPVLPTVRTCLLTEVFDEGFIELMQLVPRNPLVRGLILKLTGRMPDPECETFEQLKEWIETHCEKRAGTALRNRNARDGGIRIRVEFSDTEYGRANYSVGRSAVDEFQMSAEELLDIVQEAVASGGGLGEVVDVIVNTIDDDAWNRCDPSMQDTGDYEYNEHESTDSDDSSTSCSRDEIRHAVLDFVRAQYPELAAEL